MEWSFYDIFLNLCLLFVLIYFLSLPLSYLGPKRYQSFFSSVLELPLYIGERIFKIPYLTFVVGILGSLFLIYGGVGLIMDTINNRISLIGEEVEIVRRGISLVREYGDNWDIFTIIFRIGIGCSLLVMGIGGIYVLPKVKNKKFI